MKIFKISLCLMATSIIAFGSGASGQDQPALPATDNQVSMSIFPVIRDQAGQQAIITKAGYKVLVPGLGIAPDATGIAVYQDKQNHFWYVDKNGATVPVSEQQLQWTYAQIKEQEVQRGMGTKNPTTTIVQNSQPASNGSAMASTAAVSGLASMGGAMAGTAMASSITNAMYNSNYHGIPYGTPCYNEAGRAYYRGATGERVPVPMDTANPYLNQWGRQTAYGGNNLNGAQERRDADVVVRDGERAVRRLIR
jgi:hypothetical protein